MSKFQIILISIFGVFIIIAVAVFSLYRGAGSRAVTITIWGDIPSIEFNSFVQSTPTLNKDQGFDIRYVSRPTETIEADFTEALARGTSPDLVILTQDKIWKEKAKLALIPYANISERDFKSTFIEESELFLDANGLYALPITIDPMVLYYNRDRLSSAGIARPIAYWDEIYESIHNLSRRDAAGNLTTSAIALGEANNIPHAKDILSLLMLQAGTPITAFDGLRLRSQVSLSYSQSSVPGVLALDFYTQFSNPTKSYYSWNRSLIDAQTHFTSGDSAYYVGFASEAKAITNKNPNLNFSVSLIPQSRVANRSTTFGNLRGIAISRGSQNPSAALALAKALVSKDSVQSLSKILGLPPVRRDLYAERPTDVRLSVFYDAALQSRGWLDPDTNETDRIFRDAIESVTSGRARTVEAVNKINTEMDALTQ